MKMFKLYSGDRMPGIGLGTWQAPADQVKQAVHLAILSGYRHIDCAPIYQNEEAIGEALKESIDAKMVSRGELWITSKLWNSFHKKEDVLPALKRTLHSLQTDYLDLFLIHWPVAFKPVVGLDLPSRSDNFLSLQQAPLEETWQALGECIDKGLVKNIGVSNFSEKKLQKILPVAKHKPAVNQVECHPYLSQEKLLAFCLSHNIHLTAYSPLGKGKKDLLENRTIEDIAEKHQATASQVLLAWQLHRGVSVIPKSTTENHIKRNIESENLKLTEKDVENINKLNRNFRYVDARFYEMKNSPYTAEMIWE